MQGTPANIDRDSSELLRRAKLRLTRHRVSLATLLFCGDRHVTAEDLHREAEAAGIDISLATVYNTLHSFRAAGLVREVAIEGTRTYFDTNTSNHNHLYLEDTRDVRDFPSDQIEIAKLPEPPPGYAISKVDVVVRLVRTSPGKRTRSGS